MTITPEYIRKQAEDVELEISQEAPKKNYRYIYFILSGILIILMILMVIPRYSVRLDPRPAEIPMPSEVLGDYEIPEVQADSKAEEFLQLASVRTDIKRTADRIVGPACVNAAGPSKVCHAKALYLFVRNNMQYIGDPPDEYLKSPEESLMSLGGDCDDHAILLGSLLSAVGIRARFAFIPRHVYIEAYLPDALNRYKDENGWVALDATCESCDFGEISYSSTPPNRYLYI